jgi:hypothetical protein
MAFLHGIICGGRKDKSVRDVAGRPLRMLQVRLRKGGFLWVKDEERRLLYGDPVVVEYDHLTQQAGRVMTQFEHEHRVEIEEPIVYADELDSPDGVLLEDDELLQMEEASNSLDEHPSEY